jgi:hypothetical protein
MRTPWFGFNFKFDLTVDRFLEMRSSRLLDALHQLHAVGGYVQQSVAARTPTSHLPDGRAGWCPAMGERVSQCGEGQAG